MLGPQPHDGRAQGDPTPLISLGQPDLAPSAYGSRESQHPAAEIVDPQPSQFAAASARVRRHCPAGARLRRSGDALPLVGGG